MESTHVLWEDLLSLEQRGLGEGRRQIMNGQIHPDLGSVARIKQTSAKFFRGRKRDTFKENNRLENKPAQGAEGCGGKTSGQLTPPKHLEHQNAGGPLPYLQGRGRRKVLWRSMRLLGSPKTYDPPEKWDSNVL